MSVGAAVSVFVCAFIKRMPTEPRESVLVGCPLKIGNMYCQNNELATMTPNIIRPLLLPSSSDTATSESASNTLGKTALGKTALGRFNGKSTTVAKFALRVICTAAGDVASGVVGMSRAQSGSERSASIANKGGRTDRPRRGVELWRVVSSALETRQAR